MKLFYNDIPKLDFQEKDSITIGDFDGLHKGHKKILTFLKKLTFSNGKKKGRSCVITFKHKNKKQIYDLEYKLVLLEKQKIDFCFLFDFSHSFSQKTFQNFLTYIMSKFSFQNLVLGKGACFGFNKNGIEKNINKFAEKKHFNTFYLQKKTYENNIISSSLIKKTIGLGQFNLVNKLLGRSYHIHLSNINKKIIYSDVKEKFILKAKLKQQQIFIVEGEYFIQVKYQKRMIVKTKAIIEKNNIIIFFDKNPKRDNIDIYFISNLL